MLLVNVDREPKPANDLVSLVVDRLRIHAMPSIHSVGTPETNDAIRCYTTAPDFGPSRSRTFAVVGMHDVPIPAGKNLMGGRPRVVVIPAVEILDFTV